MKRKQIKFNKKWIIGVIIFLFIFNIPPIKTLLGFFIDYKHYRYSNNDGSFTFVEFKGHDMAMMHRRFNHFKSEKQQKPDTIIYRLFRKNPLSFWRLGEYFYDKRYKPPYKSWKEIRERRGYELEFGNKYQDF